MKRDWISRLEPSPPRELVTALRKALMELEDGGEDATPSPEHLLEAGEKLLASVLTGHCDKREAALDLLTADALITHALEIASRDANTLEDFPERVMERLAAIQGRDSPAGSR